jgi:hypothetical protein
MSDTCSVLVRGSDMQKRRRIDLGFIRAILISFTKCLQFTIYIINVHEVFTKFAGRARAVCCNQNIGRNRNNRPTYNNLTILCMCLYWSNGRGSNFGKSWAGNQLIIYYLN